MGASITTKQRRADIQRRYSAAKRERKPAASMAALRVADLTKLFRGRHGVVLPDNKLGRDCAMLMCHHLSSLSGDPRKRLTNWLHLWSPWMSLAESDALLAEAILEPRRWRADKLGWRLQLTEADRVRLGITTIGAIDVSKAERAKRRQQRDIARKQRMRRKLGSIPRAVYEAKSISQAKPWLVLGMSRAAWYRAGKPLRQV